MTNEQYTSIVSALASMEATLNYVAERVDAHVVDDKAIHEDFETRMRKSEKFRAYGAGIAAAVAFAVANLRDFFHLK